MFFATTISPIFISLDLNGCSRFEQSKRPSVGAEGLATPQINLLRLTPFPSARRGGPYKNCTTQEVDKSTYFVLVPRPINRFIRRSPKNKKDVFRHLLASFVLVGAEGFEPPTLCL